MPVISVGARYWHRNFRVYVTVLSFREEHNGTWYQYRTDDGREGECFGELLLVRGESAAALGFESDEAMHQHSVWLATHGTKEYLAWAAQLMAGLNVLDKPMDTSALKAAVDADGNISVVIAVPLSGLLDRCLDEFNDLAEEQIVAGTARATLLALDFTVVGHREGNGEGIASGDVLVKVAAQVDFG